MVHSSTSKLNYSTLGNSKALALGNSDRGYQGVYKAWGAGADPRRPSSIPCLETDALSGVQGQSPAEGYNEYVDTSCVLDFLHESETSVPENAETPELEGTPWPECAKYMLPGKCENDHHFLKVLMCGKEWCLDCGANWSWIHRRRFARWYPKAQQMQSIRYIVIEWPLASRHKLRTKRALSDMGKRVKGAMQALGYERGLRRWHFFGADGAVFNPHINVLVDGRYMDDAELQRQKEFLREVLDEPQLIVNCHYRTSPAGKVHILKYVTRATFLDRSWDEKLAEELWNFQNTNYWGKWDGEKAWGMTDKEDPVVALERGVCPECGSAIRWGRVLDSRWRFAWSLTDLGAGYYRLNDLSPPPASSVVPEVIRLLPS